MQTLRLVHQHNCQFIPKIGKEIGQGGADGQVFELLDDSKRVIKLSICFDANQTFFNIEKVLSYLENNIVPAFVTVYANKYLGSYNRKFLQRAELIDQKYFLYYYIMEKCFKITEDEKKVFHTILSHEDRGLVKNYTDDAMFLTLDGLNLGLDFDYKKVIDFYQQLKKCKIIHNDIHPRNIMKDKSGNFKLIDVDRCQITGD